MEIVIVGLIVLIVLFVVKSSEPFSAWNETQNCYSYALKNIASRPWKTQQPGYTSGIAKYSTITNKDYQCPTMVTRVQADLPNAVVTACSNKCPNGMREIAMAVAPGKDYHFYRNDSSSRGDSSSIGSSNSFDEWSHKRGEMIPEKLMDGKVPWLIKRQHGSSDYDYKDFCGCFCI